MLRTHKDGLLVMFPLSHLKKVTFELYLTAKRPVHCTNHRETQSDDPATMSGSLDMRTSRLHTVIDSYRPRPIDMYTFPTLNSNDQLWQTYTLQLTSNRGPELPIRPSRDHSTLPEGGTTPLHVLEAWIWPDLTEWKQTPTRSANAKPRDRSNNNQ